MSRMQREKGKRAEREVAAILRAQGVTGARRGVQYHGGPDSPDCVGIEGCHLEVKSHKALNVHKAMKQATDEAPPASVPVVVHKVNRGEWCVTVRLGDVRAFAERYLAAAPETSVPFTGKNRLCYPFSVEVCDDPKCPCRAMRAEAAGMAGYPVRTRLDGKTCP